MKKILILMILSCILVTGCSSDIEENTVNNTYIEMITTNEVKKIIDNYEEYSDTVIVDVRTIDEYESGHLKGAVNVPVSEIKNIDISKDKKIVVYCRSGSRSNTAAKELIKLGYEKVYDMGGINDWKFELVED